MVHFLTAPIPKTCTRPIRGPTADRPPQNSNNGGCTFLWPVLYMMQRSTMPRNRYILGTERGGVYFTPVSVGQNQPKVRRFAIANVLLIPSKINHRVTKLRPANLAMLLMYPKTWILPQKAVAHVTLYVNCTTERALRYSKKHWCYS